MRLHKHDELVEAMETAMHDCFYGGGEVPEAARAALDALLEAAVRLEVGRKAGATTSPSRAQTIAHTNFVKEVLGRTQPEGALVFDALILRLEASDDNA